MEYQKGFERCSFEPLIYLLRWFCASRAPRAAPFSDVDIGFDWVFVPRFGPDNL